MATLPARIEDWFSRQGWQLHPHQREMARARVLELFEERYQRRSTIITAQLPIPGWHDMIGEPTIADAIPDRIVHNAHRIELKGDSMRREDRNANLTSAENTEIIQTEI